jgi:hypothetical protein
MAGHLKKIKHNLPDWHIALGIKNPQGKSLSGVFFENCI